MDITNSCNRVNVINVYFGWSLKLTYLCTMRYISDMEFVYSLTVDGVIFYIGRTNNIELRYRQHLKKNKSQPFHNKYVEDLISKGVYPELNIIDYLYQKDALKLEATLIRALHNGGQFITNRTYLGLISNRLHHWPSLKSKEGIIKAIRYKQAVCIHQYAQANIREPKIRDLYEYPNDPFELKEEAI